MVSVMFYMLVLRINFILSLDCVRCYWNLCKHADNVFSAKQRPKKFKRSAGVYFFGKCLKLMIYVLNQLFSL